MTLETLNGLDQAAFVEKLGWVFEHSPWVAERAWAHRPFASLETLHAAMRDRVEAATRDEQRALLCAHPDLGARLQLTAASQAEQSGAGLDSLAEAESEMLLHLNIEYRRKFGFPFIYAVKGSPPGDLFLALHLRIENSVEEEFHEALYQVYRIAFFRLAQIIDPPNS